MKPKWHDKIPAGYPPPKNGEGQRRYALRARVLMDRESINTLAENVRKRRENDHE